MLKAFTNMFGASSTTITSCALLALTIDGLKMMCIEQKEINALAKSFRDVRVLIDYCPYCFGMFLDYLSLKKLLAQRLAEEEPALPKVW